MTDKDDDDWATLLGGGLAPDAGSRRPPPEGLASPLEGHRTEVPRRRALDADEEAPLVIDEQWPSDAFPPASFFDDQEFTANADRVTSDGRRVAGRRWAVWSGLGVAVLAVLWFGVQPMLMGARSGPERLPPILRDLPKDAGARIAEELVAAGARATVAAGSPTDTRAVTITVDTGTDARPGKTVDDVLARHGVAPPNGGQFVIEVRPARP